MAKRKSKDPRKPSKAYLEQIGETAKPKETDNAPEPSTAPTIQGKGKQPKKENDVLRRAIQELGGDDEDYDLLNGVDSDDEEPQAPAAKKDDVIDVRQLTAWEIWRLTLRHYCSQKKLKSELASFIKGLDLSSVAPDADEEEEDDEEEEEEEEEDDVEQESVAEEIESAEQSGESEASDEDDDASATDDDDDDSEEDASSQASSVSAPGEENDGLVIKSGLQNTAEARIDVSRSFVTWKHRR